MDSDSVRADPERTWSAVMAAHRPRRCVIPRSQPELEQLLSTRPDVTGAKAIDYGPSGPVLVVVQPNVFCSGPELRDISAASLGDAGSRVTVILSAELPTLEEPYPDPDAILAQSSYTYSYDPPTTRTEMLLAATWNEVLGRSRTGVLDDFLDLGGDSVGAVRLLNHISKNFGVELSFADFFEFPCIRAVAALIDEAE